MRKGARPVHVVADTNTIVSRLLWYGNPRRVLDAARTGAIPLSTSASLLAELAEVLQRPRLAQRLVQANVTPHTLVFGYAALARLVVPAPIGPVIASQQIRMTMPCWRVRLRPEPRSLSQGTAISLLWSHTRVFLSSRQRN
jgi:hypothetical protein